MEIPYLSTVGLMEECEANLLVEHMILLGPFLLYEALNIISGDCCLSRYYIAQVWMDIVISVHLSNFSNHHCILL